MHKERIYRFLKRIFALSKKCAARARAAAAFCCNTRYRFAAPAIPAVTRVLEALRQSRLPLISILTAGVLLMPMFSFMRIGVVVKVDGHVLGYVEDQAEIQDACRIVEQESSEVLGQPFSLGADISYETVVTTPSSFIEPEQLPNMIANNVHSLATIAVVKVDGVTIGATAVASQAEQVLDNVKMQFAQGDANAEVSFVQDVTVETIQAPTELLRSEEDLLAALTSETMQEELYTVGEDDTMTSIARKHGMRHQELLKLNPDVIPERMAPGSKVLLRAAEPTLSVKVVRTEEYTEEIAFDTIETENASLAKGKKQTLQEGVAGVASVKAQITEINGKETERMELSRDVTQAPVDALVEIGTKSVGIGSGNLIRPVRGTLTSGFKFRWGRQHKGLDFGVSTGSAVVAADSGRVITSEYSTGGYGYYVVIDHGNGMRTLYGHNSQLVAQVGDVVEQGQLIAYSGNTGNSTGPHCHFEVIVNGTNVDPAQYV